MERRGEGGEEERREGGERGGDGGRVMNKQYIMFHLLLLIHIKLLLT